MQIQTSLHVLLTTFHKCIVALQCLFDGQQENYADKDHTVGADQVEHLERLGIAEISALDYIVHALNQHVSPDVKG